MFRPFLSLSLILILSAAGTSAQSPYANFEDCPCKFLGVGVPWSDYADPAKLAALIDGKAEPYLLVDVRSVAEYESGHIRSAINVPVDAIAEKPPAVAKDALIIVYCRSGIRSAKAAEGLRELGYRGVVDFGGVSRWPGALTLGSEP